MGGTQKVLDEVNDSRYAEMRRKRMCAGGRQPERECVEERKDPAYNLYKKLKTKKKANVATVG